MSHYSRQCVALMALTATACALRSPDASPRSPQIVPIELEWQRLSSGVEVATLYGDRSKAERFGLRLRYPQGYVKRPHYHPEDAFVTVLSGSYHRGYGNVFDKTRGIKLVTGTFSVNPAGVAHYEWVDEAAELEVHASGPWTSVYVDSSGRALPQDAQTGCGDACGAHPCTRTVAGAIAKTTRTPTVLQPDELVWTKRDDGDEVALLYGDPHKPGPFVMRVRSHPGSREEPHHHPRAAFVTVLSGGFQVGSGRLFDAEASAQMRRHDAFVAPAGLAHFKYNDAPSVVEVHATGPWSTTKIRD